MSVLETSVLPHGSPVRTASDPASRHRHAPADGTVRPGALARWSPPSVPSFAIRRMRLEARLGGHPDRHVVLVGGPAGAGKTVLVAQWVRAHGRPCAWLSIDATHDNETILLRRLIEAVDHLAPGGSTALRDAVAWSIDHNMLRDVLASVTPGFGSGITLVLDDVDRLHDRAARQVVELLVEHPPAGVRLVLISRSKPRLRIERARLRGDLVEVMPAELRFERAEIDQLASVWTGRHPDTAELEQATLGWAAGLRLAHLDGTTRDTPPPSLAGSDSIAGEYIREELIDRCSPSTRSFLEVSCWLPAITEPLCAAVAGHEIGRPSPTGPETGVLPILPVTSSPGVFRHPPILTRILQHEFCRRDPRAARSARRRAADACRETGDLVSAIELFLQAACADEAADACGQLANAGESSLRAVDELFLRHPDLAPVSRRWVALRARAAVAGGRVDEAIRLLDLADVLGDADGLDLVTAQAVVAEHHGDVSGLLSCADRLLRPGAPTGAGSCSAVQAHGWRVRASVWAGEAAGARAALGDMDHAVARSARGAAADVALARAWVAWLDGGVPGLAEDLVAARRDVGDTGSSSAETALLAGSALRERNQVAKAVPLIQHARSVAAMSSHRVVASLAASELARCLRATGAGMEALELVVSTRAEQPDLPPAIDAHLRGTEVRVRLDQGDLAGAEAALRHSPSGTDAQLLAARVALAGFSAGARALLETVDARLPRQAVEELLLRARLPDSEPAERSAAIIEAVAVGGSLGLVRTFLDEGPELCRRLPELALEHTDRTLGRLAAVACHELAMSATRRRSAPVEQLTARELAVLRMLPLRMSNREMAAQLYISVNTLKTHVRAIYRKLDVPHRSAAVRRAAALQLV